MASKTTLLQLSLSVSTSTTHFRVGVLGVHSNMYPCHPSRIFAPILCNIRLRTFIMCCQRHSCCIVLTTAYGTASRQPTWQDRVSRIPARVSWKRGHINPACQHPAIQLVNILQCGNDEAARLLRSCRESRAIKEYNRQKSPRLGGRTSEPRPQKKT